MQWKDVDVPSCARCGDVDAGDCHVVAFDASDESASYAGSPHDDSDETSEVQDQYSSSRMSVDGAQQLTMAEYLLRLEEQGRRGRDV